MAPCQAGVILPSVDRDFVLGRLVYVVVGCSFYLLCLSDYVACSYHGDPEVLDVVEGGFPFMCGHACEFSVEGLESEGNECR